MKGGFYKILRRCSCISFHPALAIVVLLIAIQAGTAQTPDYVPNIPPYQPGVPNVYPEWRQTVSDEAAAAKARVEALRARAIRDYYKQLGRDTDKLLILATSLKAYVDQSQDSVLPAKMTEKARKMADLAYDLRRQMYMQKVPHVGTAGNFKTTEGEPENQTVVELRYQVALALELATDLDHTMNSYLQETNQNTTSLTDTQKARARKIVDESAKLEALAYGLGHPTGGS